MVPRVHFLDRHHCQQIILGVAQRDFVVQLHVVRGVDWESHRERKNVAISQTHVVQHSLVVFLAHKPVQGRKSTGGQEFQVANGAFRYLD